MVTACHDLYAAFDAWWVACGQLALAPATREALAERCAATTTLPGLTVTREAIDGCAQRVASSACAQLPEECVAWRYRRAWAEKPHASYSSTVQDIASPSQLFGSVELFPRTVGSLAPGQACDESRQCATGLCSTEDGSDLLPPTGPSDCGVCVVEKRTGEACGGAAICEAGDDCVAGRCQEYGLAAGQPCTSVKGESSCQKSTFCNGFSEGQCVPRPGLGEAFDGQAQCLDGLWPVDGRCQTMHTVADGEPCGGATFCPDGSTCAQGVCRRPRGDVPAGGDCGFDRCQPPLACLDAHCATPVTEAEICQASCGPPSRCLAGGQCVPLLAEGSPCNEYECRPGLFCGGGPPYGQGTSWCQPSPTVGEHCDSSALCPLSLQCIDGACRPLDACSLRR